MSLVRFIRKRWATQFPRSIVNCPCVDWQRGPLGGPLGGESKQFLGVGFIFPGKSFAMTQEGHRLCLRTEVRRRVQSIFIARCISGKLELVLFTVITSTVADASQG